MTISDQGRFRFLGIYAKNREEWIVTDWACIKAGITSVPLYDTLGKESIDFILDQCDIRTVVCSADKVKVLIDLRKAGKIPKLHCVIFFDPLPQESRDEVEGSGLSLVPYGQALTDGTQFGEV